METIQHHWMDYICIPGNQGSDWAIWAWTDRQAQREDMEEGQTRGNVDADQHFKLFKSKIS
eukprot:5005231-Ditylum_brightwellii.AAC.2